MTKGSENLIPYEKGQSGNPKGRPKGGKNTKTIIKEYLKAMTKCTGEDGKDIDISNHEAILLAQLVNAKGGSVKSAEFLLERLDGKVTDKIEHSGEIDTGVTINIRKDLLPKDLDDLE